MDLLNHSLPSSRPARARRRGERGAAFVEMVFVLPLLVFLLFAMADFSLVLRDYMAVQNAARAAVRSASLSRIPCDKGNKRNAGVDAAKKMLDKTHVEVVTGIDVSHADLQNDLLCNPGRIQAEIKVTRKLPFLSGFAPLAFSSVPLVARATAMNENGNN